MLDDNDNLDFGHLPPAVDQLLQQGVAAHFSDRALAERHYLAALSLAPDALPAHRCLVKHYNRCRQFDKALAAARGEEAMDGEQIVQHVRDDPRLVDEQSELGRPGDHSVIDRRGRGSGRCQLDPHRQRGRRCGVPQVILARQLEVPLVSQVKEVGGQSLAAAIAVLDRQRGAEDVPDVGEREPPALAGVLAQGSEQAHWCTLRPAADPAKRE